MTLIIVLTFAILIGLIIAICPTTPEDPEKE